MNIDINVYFNRSESPTPKIFSDFPADAPGRTLNSRTHKGIFAIITRM
jgi:hypothetical protein